MKEIGGRVDDYTNYHSEYISNGRKCNHFRQLIGTIKIKIKSFKLVFKIKLAMMKETIGFH